MLFSWFPPKVSSTCGSDLESLKVLRPGKVLSGTA